MYTRFDSVLPTLTRTMYFLSRFIDVLNIIRFGSILRGIKGVVLNSINASGEKHSPRIVKLLEIGIFTLLGVIENILGKGQFSVFFSFISCSTNLSDLCSFKEVPSK